MTVTPHLVIGSVDVSHYVKTIHAEMACNQETPGTYDIVLANIGGQFFAGKFDVLPADYVTDISQIPSLDPKAEIECSIINKRSSCEGSTTTVYPIFTGEVQHAEVDETECKITGSCFQGGFSTGLKNHLVFNPDMKNSDIANTLLDEFGFTGKRHIAPFNDEPNAKSPEYAAILDFNVAFSELAADSQSIFFFDESGMFCFVSPLMYRGTEDLTGKILTGTTASTMVNYCNWVIVHGGSYQPRSANPGSEIPTHEQVLGEAKDEEDIQFRKNQGYGPMKAVEINVPNCPKEQCQEIAENMLDYYKQYKNVPQIKVIGIAPVLLRKVAYAPFNGMIPPQSCGGSPTPTNSITGLVTKRVIELSADGGFITTLDVATSAAALEAAGIDISNELDTKTNSVASDGKKYSQTYPGKDDPAYDKWNVSYQGRETPDGTVEYIENSFNAEGFPSGSWSSDSSGIPSSILNQINSDLAG